MSLNLGFEYFIDSALQTATKRLTHKKLWNVVIHFVCSWVIAWASLCIGCNLIPFWFQAGLILLKCLICILQEPPIGFAYSIMYSAVAYYTLWISAGITTFQAFLVIAVCFGLLLLGHVTFEGNPLSSRPPRGDSLVFKIVDLANEFFLAQFHFSLLLLVRLDLLPILKWRSDAALHKLIDRVQELKYGKKAP